MTTLLTFPPKRDGDRIPIPFNHREGDCYIQLSFEDADSPPPGFSYSVVFVARLGGLVDGTLHLLNTPDGAVVAELGVRADGKIGVHSFHPGYISRVCAREQLEVLGPVVEVWPSGFDGHRFVLDPTLPNAESLPLPLLSLSN